MLDGMRGGRGRGRGDMRGGRFFHRPPFRPDGMRGNYSNNDIAKKIILKSGYISVK